MKAVAKVECEKRLSVTKNQKKESKLEVKVNCENCKEKRDQSKKKKTNFSRINKQF